MSNYAERKTEEFCSESIGSDLPQGILRARIRLLVSEVLLDQRAACAEAVAEADYNEYVTNTQRNAMHAVCVSAEPK